MSFIGRARTGEGGGDLTIESGGALHLRGSLSRLGHLTIQAGRDVDVLRRMAPRQTLQVNAGGVVTGRGCPALRCKQRPWAPDLGSEG